jgi:hypothetical protein
LQFIFRHTVQFFVPYRVFRHNSTGRITVLARAIHILCQCFHRRQGLRRRRARTSLLCLDVRFEVEEVVHWMSQILFAAEIALGSQNRCVPKEELNLLKFPSVGVT